MSSSGSRPSNVRSTIPSEAARLQPDGVTIPKTSSGTIPSSPILIPRLVRKLSKCNIEDMATPSPNISISSKRKTSIPIPPGTIAGDSTKTTDQNKGVKSQKETLLLDNSGLLDLLPLPTPKQPSKCPLFCCFYAVFDNKVGPKVACQSPPYFMDQDINVPLDSIHKILEETFEVLLSRPPDVKSTSDDSKANAPFVSEGSHSIFDATSEYIITGNELTGNVIKLSAHSMHIITRPTIISDERYERNALLFCVGFVLRRTEDPRPFHPILSELALTLRSMEIESQFLSKDSTHQQLQVILGRILVSLNSSQMECNLLLKGNTLNLKLFQTPKLPADPVADHAVPILLRRDWQVQMYDWDLAINWVVLHIDGVTNARQLSRKAEVDMEMVRACLRVLKHHGVIALTDMFFYSNRYECTDRAAAMLAGKENKLLQDAVDYVLKRPAGSQTSPFLGGVGSPKQSSSPIAHQPKPGQGSPSYTPVRIPSTKHEAYQDLSWYSSRREDQRELRVALAELYCSCNRNVSFGDLWVALASDRYMSTEKSSGRGERHSSGGRRAAAVRDRVIRDIDVAGSDETKDYEAQESSPSQMDSYMDSWKRNVDRASIDWKHLFQTIDHRRFTTFGLVNRLITRVHCYPFLLETNSFDDSGLSGMFTMRRPSENDNTRPGLRYVSRSDSHDEQVRLSHAVAAMMDGTHSDDDVVSIFEKPIDELIDLVRRIEMKEVISIYSVASELG